MPYRFVNVSGGERIATVTLNNPPSNLLTAFMEKRPPKFTSR